MAPAQPRAIVYNPPNNRGSRELRLMIALRHERVHSHDSNPFVDHVLGELQKAFEAQYQVNGTGEAIINEEELSHRKVECIKAGLYALRSILTAWLEYPAVGGRLDGASIGAVDFRFTAMNAPAEKPEGQLAAQYARIMADTVDPPQGDYESAPHAQLRVNNCFLAIKKQFMVLFPLLDREQLSDYLFEDETLSEDEATPLTYTLPTSSALHPPSTAAQLLSARGLMEGAEWEEDDNQHIFVSGAVLKSKADKRADLAVQVAKAKKAEMEQAARPRVRASASKTTATAKGKGNAGKRDILPVEGEEDEMDEEEVGSPTKKAAPKKAAANKIKGGRKRPAAPATGKEEDKSYDEETQQPAKQIKVNPRKRSAPVADTTAAEDDEDDTASKPAPKKRAKSTPAAKNTASGSSPSQAGASNTSGTSGSVAPNITKRGGAAPKWLQDEDDMVKQMIVDHPDWPMPKVYREYSAWVANTPYRRHDQVSVAYRADFVEFPKGIIVSDKERRKFDIAWRTYESVRQHCEKFKASVSNANTSPPYTWDPCQTNLAAGQPKRAPPPRPAFFNNVARTPVPPAVGQAVPAPTVSSAARSSATGTPAPPATSATSRRSSGWNALNYRAAPVVEDDSADEADKDADEAAAEPAQEAEDEAAAPEEGSAEVDAGVDSIEDFVAQQSASSSSVGEVEVVVEDLSE